MDPSFIIRYRCLLPYSVIVGVLGVVHVINPSSLGSVLLRGLYVPGTSLFGCTDEFYQS